MDDETKINLSEHERVKKILHEEILRKDKEIEKLKEENKILLKTSIKRSQDLEEFKEKVGARLN